MKTLVIGGAGYIGSHVVLALLNAGHEVGVYDNLCRGTRDNLFSTARFVEADILDEKTLSSVLAEGWDAVVHLAALKAAGESMLDPDSYAQNNIAGTIAILRAMNRSACRVLVFSSSAAVYGEPQYLPVDENHPTNPENFYGFTKLEIERVLDWYRRLCGFRFAALRYFNAAGYDPDGRIMGLEQNPANLLPLIMEVAVGRRPTLEVFGTDYDTPDGTCIRDYVHVSDLADAHVASVDMLAHGGDSIICNLGSQTGISVRELLEVARDITGREIPAVEVDRRPGDPARLVAGSSLAHKRLGWKAERSDVATLVETSFRAYKAQAG